MNNDWEHVTEEYTFKELIVVWDRKFDIVQTLFLLHAWNDDMVCLKMKPHLTLIKVVFLFQTTKLIHSLVDRFRYLREKTYAAADE